MVVLEEITNTFWGITLSEGKRHSETLEGIVHVSMAALEPGSTADDKAVSVMIHHKKSDFILCSLNATHVLQQTLDLSFNQGEEVVFYLSGKGTVHLTGYVVPGDDYDSASDEDFKPQSSFVESDDDDDDDDDNDDDDASSDEDTDLTKESKKRKKGQAVKQSKKPRVEIVDEDEENDESLSSDDEDGESDSEEDEVEDEGEDSLDDEDEDEDGLLDSEAKEDNKFHESDESDEDDDDIEDDYDGHQDEIPKQKNAKKKNKKPSALPANQPKEAKLKKEKESEKPEENTSSQSQSEINENKKKKKKKNKKKKNEATAAASSAGSNSLPEKQAPSKSTVVEGVAIEDLKVGHGPEAKKGNTVHVYYTGKLPNGKLFDSKIGGKAFKFRLGKKEVIKGWEVGVEGMKVGGKRKLVIPPKMGYGSQKVGNSIPPNSTLHFEVELKAVN